ncbi:MAG: adenine phosphoribosyltransferase [Candidatus Nitrosopelagicus sp.]|jgi:adenine phosphoribosyltransferase|nr:adenine phosphoribosyltransferase [Candidatus Nitrosopelagicus sp.]|tara:strand:+ start:1217 stop:1729 length:513 start_codon:yes stop_codon:yes gene_type:complete
MNLKDKVAEYPNFPKKGILFRDFSPILKDPSSLSLVVDEFAKKYHPNDIDVFAGIESRGFILACALAQKYNKGMILLRKAGKLPGKTVKVSYSIEYGKAQMEIQKTALEKNERVLICDDLLATGGTAKAAAKLVEKLGAKVIGFAFIIELTSLKGIEKIKEYRTESLVVY